MYFVGADLGTSAVKLLLMDEEGNIKNIVSKEYPLYFPHPGWSEQNPEDWFTQFMAGIRELVKGYDASEVARSLGIQTERSAICGGGAKSPLWRKIVANVLNLTLDIIESEEGPGLGGAMLAAVGCGVYPDVKTAAERIVKIIDTVAPEPALAEKYEERYQQFKRIYPAVKGLYS